MLSQEPKISVILPFRNAGETIREAIKSIHEQTYQNWRLLAIDDHSDDDSSKIVKSLSQTDGRIELLRSSDEGIVAALQTGTAASDSEFIARMDADDVSHPTRFEKQIQFLTANPDVALCGTNVRMIGEDIGSGRKAYAAWINRCLSPTQVAQNILIECPIAHPTFLARRTAFETGGGYLEEAWPEDYSLVLRLWKNGYKLANVPEALFDWRESPTRLSMTNSRYSPKAFRDLKLSILRETVLKKFEDISFWGAGQVGKPWLKQLSPSVLTQVFDVNERKVGTSIHGVPVVDYREMPQATSGTLLLVAVGAPGKREEIAAFCESKGYINGENLIFLA